MFLIPLLILLPIVIWLVREYDGGHAPAGSSLVGIRRANALDILGERYARGEINQAEYLEKKRDLL